MLKSYVKGSSNPNTVPDLLVDLLHYILYLNTLDTLSQCFGDAINEAVKKRSGHALQENRSIEEF